MGSFSHYVEQFQFSFIRCAWAVFLKTQCMGPFSFFFPATSLIEFMVIKTWVWENKKIYLTLMILCSHLYIWNQFRMFYGICFKQCEAFGSLRVVIPGVRCWLGLIKRRLGGRVWMVYWLLCFRRGSSVSVCAGSSTSHILFRVLFCFKERAWALMPVGIQETGGLAFLISLSSFFFHSRRVPQP